MTVTKTYTLRIIAVDKYSTAIISVLGQAKVTPHSDQLLEEHTYSQTVSTLIARYIHIK